MISRFKRKKSLIIKPTGLRVVRKKSDVTEETLHKGAGWELGL